MFLKNTVGTYKSIDLTTYTDSGEKVTTLTEGKVYDLTYVKNYPTPSTCYNVEGLGTKYQNMATVELLYIRGKLLLVDVAGQYILIDSSDQFNSEKLSIPIEAIRSIAPKVCTPPNIADQDIEFSIFDHLIHDMLITKEIKNTIVDILVFGNKYHLKNSLIPQNQLTVTQTSLEGKIDNFSYDFITSVTEATTYVGEPNERYYHFINDNTFYDDIHGSSIMIMILTPNIYHNCTLVYDITTKKIIETEVETPPDPVEPDPIDILIANTIVKVETELENSEYTDTTKIYFTNNGPFMWDGTSHIPLINKEII